MLQLQEHWGQLRYTEINACPWGNAYMHENITEALIDLLDTAQLQKSIVNFEECKVSNIIRGHNYVLTAYIDVP